MDTVNGPAKMAQASPFSKEQLLNSRESCAEKLCVTWQACPMKQRMIFAASAMTAPDEMIKSWAITLSPIYTGASLLLFTVPFSKRVQFSMVACWPMFTLRIVPALIIFTFSPIVP